MKAFKKNNLANSGFDNFMFIFSLFSAFTLLRNKIKRDFLFFSKLIPNEGIVHDKNVNIGIMTAHLSRKLNKAEIFTFEPVPNNPRALQRIINFFHLNNVDVMDIGSEVYGSWNFFFIPR